MKTKKHYKLSIFLSSGINGKDVDELMGFRYRFLHDKKVAQRLFDSAVSISMPVIKNGK